MRWHEAGRSTGPPHVQVKEQAAHLPAQVPGGDLLIVWVVHQPVLQDSPPLRKEVVFQQANELLPAHHQSTLINTGSEHTPLQKMQKHMTNLDTRPDCIAAQALVTSPPTMRIMQGLLRGLMTHDQQGRYVAALNLACEAVQPTQEEQQTRTWSTPRAPASGLQDSLSNSWSRQYASFGKMDLPVREAHSFGSNTCAANNL